MILVLGTRGRRYAADLRQDLGDRELAVVEGMEDAQAHGIAHRLEPRRDAPVELVRHLVHDCHPAEAEATPPIIIGYGLGRRQTRPPAAAPALDSDGVDRYSRIR